MGRKQCNSLTEVSKPKTDMFTKTTLWTDARTFLRIFLSGGGHPIYTCFVFLQIAPPTAMDWKNPILESQSLKNLEGEGLPKK